MLKNVLLIQNVLRTEIELRYPDEIEEKSEPSTRIHSKFQLENPGLLANNMIFFFS